MIFWQHSSASRRTSLCEASVELISSMMRSLTLSCATFFLPRGCSVTNSPRSWHATARVVESVPGLRSSEASILSARKPLSSNFRTLSAQNLLEWMKPHWREPVCNSRSYLSKLLISLTSDAIVCTASRMSSYSSASRHFSNSSIWMASRRFSSTISSQRSLWARSCLSTVREMRTTFSTRLLARMSFSFLITEWSFSCLEIWRSKESVQMQKTIL
mmetsp:Transcript_44056/g.130449  ORF Transcript_44056/g.130449 Transcript_44056/m.130449 type:complete len:216 (-) Transcript_44056:737-1384(-)